MKALLANARLYYAISLLSVVLAVAGFSYNTWRLEVSEENNTVRTAAFEIFEHLAEFEHIIYSAHYDKNVQEGSPRKAWVKMGLVADLSVLMSGNVQEHSAQLTRLWQEHWQHISTNEQSVNLLILQIDKIRSAIKEELISLS